MLLVSFPSFGSLLGCFLFLSFAVRSAASFVASVSLFCCFVLLCCLHVKNYFRYKRMPAVKLMMQKQLALIQNELQGQK